MREKKFDNESKDKNWHKQGMIHQKLFDNQNLMIFYSNNYLQIKHMKNQLLNASVGGNLAEVKKILNRGADINQGTHRGTTSSKRLSGKN